MNSLKEQVAMCHESIAAKDQVVVTLTNHIGELEKSDLTANSPVPSTMDLLTDAKEIEKLKARFASGRIGTPS